MIVYTNLISLHNGFEVEKKSVSSLLHLQYQLYQLKVKMRIFVRNLLSSILITPPYSI